MTALFILFIPGLPLLLALLLKTPLRPLALALIPTAALPALLLALMAPSVVVELPWLLLGSRFGIDTTGSVMLLLAGVLWTAASLFAHDYLRHDRQRERFYFYYLLTLAGNVGAIVALDVVSYYLFFTLMTIAAFGVIVHNSDDESRRAGRIYLILALLGEVMILAAVWLVASSIGTDMREIPAALVGAAHSHWIIALALVGFAIKMGVVPLHVWLPLAHPCAPIPASAVLSGIILKMGLLGWLRFLPLGHMALPTWGELCLMFGLLTAFYAAIVGCFQHRPKTILAYSSISQMGLVTALLGLALLNPDDWPLLMATILLFCLYHGLAKAALFLGLATIDRSRWTWALLALPALALVGAPLTSGALAKSAYKNVSQLAPSFWLDGLPTLLTLSSTVTGLLMARFLYVSCSGMAAVKPQAPIRWLAFSALILLTFVLPLWWASISFADLGVTITYAVTELQAWLPVLIAALAMVLAYAVESRRGGRWFTLPEGDVLVWLEALAQYRPRCLAWVLAHKPSVPAKSPLFLSFELSQRWQSLCRRNSDAVVGLCCVVLVVAISVLLTLSSP